MYKRSPNGRSQKMVSENEKRSYIDVLYGDIDKLSTKIKRRFLSVPYIAFV